MNRPAWLVYALAVAVTLLLVALILGGCAAHKPADKPFCLAFHDDLGLGASFTVIAYYQSSVKQISATLPPNGDVVVEIGETPPPRHLDPRGDLVSGDRPVPAGRELHVPAVREVGAPARAVSEWRHLGRVRPMSEAQTPTREMVFAQFKKYAQGPRKTKLGKIFCRQQVEFLLEQIDDPKVTLDGIAAGLRNVASILESPDSAVIQADPQTPFRSKDFPCSKETS